MGSLCRGIKPLKARPALCSVGNKWDISGFPEEEPAWIRSVYQAKHSRSHKVGWMAARSGCFRGGQFQKLLPELR